MNENKKDEVLEQEIHTGMLLRFALSTILSTVFMSINLKGKKIVTFCTSGGSGISGSIKDVKASAKGAKIVTGKDLTYASYKSVAAWVKKNIK